MRTIERHIKTAVLMAGENPQDIEDAVQDTWIKLLSSDGYASAKHPFAYAAQTARNVVVDRRRARQCRSRWRAEMSVEPNVIGRRDPSAYDALLARERLQRVIARMDAATRETAREVAQGWSVAESAAEHGISGSGAEKRRAVVRAMVLERVEGWK